MPNTTAEDETRERRPVRELMTEMTLYGVDSNVASGSQREEEELERESFEKKTPSVDMAS